MAAPIPSMASRPKITAPLPLSPDPEDVDAEVGVLIAAEEPADEDTCKLLLD